MIAVGWIALFLYLLNTRLLNNLLQSWLQLDEAIIFPAAAP